MRTSGFRYRLCCGLLLHFSFTTFGWHVPPMTLTRPSTALHLAPVERRKVLDAVFLLGTSVAVPGDSSASDSKLMTAQGPVNRKIGGLVAKIRKVSNVMVRHRGERHTSW